MKIKPKKKPIERATQVTALSSLREAKDREKRSLK